MLKQSEAIITYEQPVSNELIIEPQYAIKVYANIHSTLEVQDLIEGPELSVNILPIIKEEHVDAHTSCSLHNQQLDLTLSICYQNILPKVCDMRIVSYSKIGFL